MGRKSAVLDVDGYLPGVTLSDLKLLMKKGVDPKHLKRSGRGRRSGTN